MPVMRSEVAAIIDSLPTHQKTILSLFYESELTAEEIAEVLDLPVSEVTLTLAIAINNVFICQMLLQTPVLYLH